MNDQQRAAMIRPRGKSEAPHMIAAYRAMQMALEALKLDEWGFVSKGNKEAREKAITALREALAQPQGEPVAWMHVQGYYEEPSIGPLTGDELGRSWEQCPLYATPPSVEAAIEATKEKAAKVCEQVDTDAFGKERPTPEDCAAAIRSMK